MARVIKLRVTATPNDTYGETNIAYVNPADVKGAPKFVQVNRCIFSLKEDPIVAAGTIAMNLMQRKSCGVSNNSTPPDMIDVDPAYVPPTAPSLTMKVDVEYFSASKTGGTLDYAQFAEQIHGRFSGQYFVVGQVVLFIFEGVKFQLTIAALEAIAAGAAAAPCGMLAKETTVSLVPKAKCNIQMVNVPDSAVDAGRAPIMKDFNLEKLGIGGLRAEFGQVFRRAFASRIFPQSVVRKLGIKHVKGILLFGPPGTGKTLIARKIGEVLNCVPPKIVNGPEIFNKFVGVAEENIRKLFADAEADAPKGDQSPLHLIIFDEFDSICKQRGAVRDGTNVSDNVVNQLLAKIDGVNQLNNVLLIGMTNRKDLIDEAILRPGRFEVHVEIGLPDEHGRVEILHIHTKLMVSNDIMDKDVDINVIAERTKNFSGAELEGLVRSAQSFGFSRHIDFDNPTATIDPSKIKIAMADFERALSEVKPAFGAAADECTNVARNGIIDFGPEWQGIQRRTFEFISRLKDSSSLSSLSILIHGDVGSGKSSLASHLALTSGFPFVKFLSTDQLVGYGELQKCNIFRKAFDDATKSNLSVIILDDVERLVEYSIGGRFSNTLLQALLVLIKRPPPLGKKLLVIATCQSLTAMEELEIRRSVTVDVQMPNLAAQALPALCHGMKCNWRSPKELASAQELMGDMTLPMKKFLFLIEMAQDEAAGRVITYDSFNTALQSAIENA